MTEASTTDEFDAELVGGGLRAARTRAGMSVRGLARAVGCSPSLISQIERGLTKPSVSILYRLSGELQVSVDSLFEDGSDAELAPTKSRPPVDGDVHIQRVEDRHILHLASGVDWVRLSPKADTQIDFLEALYPPGATSDGEDFNRHAGYEYAVVLEGELTVLVEDQRYVLKAGESIAHDARRPHMHRNETDEPTRIIWCVVRRENQV